MVKGYDSTQHLSPAEVAALPAAMLAYHLLLADWYLRLPRLEPIAVEVRALAWLDVHYATVANAIVS